MDTVQSDISILQFEDLSFLKHDGSRSMTGSLDMGNFNISNLSDPTSPDQAATKSYVDSVVPGAEVKKVQKVVLTSTDITNQYVELSFKAVVDSITASSERINLIVVSGADVDADFEQDNAGIVTRLNFQGPSASAGESPLSDGQIIYFNYVIA
jgi:hypothetical protein